MGFEDLVHLAWHTIGTGSHPFGKSKVLSHALVAVDIYIGKK